jgi:hypothetical protein
MGGPRLTERLIDLGRFDFRERLARLDARAEVHGFFLTRQFAAAGSQPLDALCKQAEK